MNASPATRPVRVALVTLSILVTAAPGLALAEASPLRATDRGAQAAPAAKAAGAVTRGKVLETMDAANYTYAKVDTGSGSQWIAGPHTPLEVGDVVEWQGGMKMENFTSKALGRSFDSVLLVDRITGGGGAAGTGAATGGKATGSGSPHGALSAKDAGEIEITGIAKAPGGLTVAEIFDRRTEFEGKEVTLRGKVVKFNSGVMKRNWLHIRDGSRTAAGDNDLTVTTDGEAAVGDTVLVRGTLALNKDFGFNYRYAVMVEGAKVTVDKVTVDKATVE